MKKIFTLLSFLFVSTMGLWAQATSNPGFETWTTGGFFPTYDVCTGWDSPNSQTAITGTFVCIKTTDAHSGSYAIKLIAKTIAGMQDAPGVATTGILPTSNGGTITGGVAYTMRPDSIVGWYKYTPGAAGDNATISFRLEGSGGFNDSIAVANYNTPSATIGSYTRFAHPLTYYSANTPANSTWVLVSTKDAAVPVINSTLFVDDVDLVFVVRDSIGITAGTNPGCEGQSLTFTSYPHNGGTNPTYQWKVDGVNVGTNSATFTSSTLTNGQVVTCELTSNLTGVTISGGTTVTSNSITVNINTVPTPTITQNGTVLTSSSATGNQWYLNGNIISGATSQTYTTTQSGSYTVVVTDNGCTSATSAAVNVSSTFTAGVSISGTNPACVGQSVTFTATPTNGGTSPSYQWMVDGANVGTDSPTYTTSTLTTGQVVTCVMTSNLSGVQGNPATSNAITMTVSAVPPTPVVTQNGAVLTSDASTGNQWFMNGNAVNGATNQVYTATQNGSYTVVVTVGGCPSAASNAVNVINAGVEESENGIYYSVYPNPNNGNFTILLNTMSKDTYTLQIQNAIGQTVHQEVLTNFAGQYQKQIDIGQFGKGIYMISIGTSNVRTAKKIVVY